MIKKINDEYVVLSEKKHRNVEGKMVQRVFGCYQTREEAEKRLRQVEYFKQHAAKPGA